MTPEANRKLRNTDMRCKSMVVRAVPTLVTFGAVVFILIAGVTVRINAELINSSFGVG